LSFLLSRKYFGFINLCLSALQSTLDTTLEEVGFIHCSFPHQTMEIVNRKFTDRENLILLLIDESKIKSPVKHEGALSGRAGIFPHIYGPLNTNAVYEVLPLTKNDGGNFTTPFELKKLELASVSDKI
jgi:uncharacterized protein (DUF952 family)